MSDFPVRPLGPVGSVQPPLPATELKKKVKAFDDKEMRVDGRQLRQSRRLHLQPGIVTEAKGSCYLELGETKVICAVYGPREIYRREQYSDSGKIACEVEIAAGARPNLKSMFETEEEKDLSVLFENALTLCVQLDQYPKSVIDVKVSIIQDDGAFTSAALTCASVALGHAGIHMYDMVASCSIGLVDGKNLVDCTKQEENVAEGELMIGLLPNLNQISAISQTGDISPAEASSLYDEALDVCAQVYSAMQEALRQSLINGDQ